MRSGKLSIAVVTDPRSWYADAGIIGGLARALAAGGHGVYTFDRSKLLSLLAAHRESLLDALRDTLERRGIDFVLGCNLNGCLIGESRGTLRSLFDAWGLWSVTYIDDLVSGFLDGAGPMRAQIFSVLLQSEKSCFAMHREEDARRVEALTGRAFYLPNGFDDRIRVGAAGARSRRVVFVGNARSEGGWRQRALLDLQSQDLELYGAPRQPAVENSDLRQSYRGRLMDTSAVYRLYQETRICLDANDEEGVVSDRVFQAMGNGCMVITPFKEELVRYFEPGRDVVAYREPGEIPVLVRHYLKRDSEREAIARSGCRRVREFHTYIERSKALLSRWRDLAGGGTSRPASGRRRAARAGSPLPARTPPPTYSEEKISHG